MTTLREAAQQAIALICSARLCEVNSMSSRQEMLRLLIEATDLLRAALAQQSEPVQEPVACEPQYANDDGWCDWVCPKPIGYLMQCCGCDLIHEVESRVSKYQPRPSEEFEVVDDPDLQVQWRMKRRDDISPQCPAEPVQEPVAWMYTGIKQDGTEHGPHLVWRPAYMDAMSASKGAQATPLYTAPPKAEPPVDPAEYDDAGAAERYNRGLK